MPSYTYIGDDSPDGTMIGARAVTASVPSKVGFFGATPVAQRASAVQATSLNSASSYLSIASNNAAVLYEVTQTLIGLGVWKGAA